MHSTRWTRIAVTAALAATLLGKDARAGNGTVPAPTGTIYYQDLSTLDPADGTVVLYAMDGEGGGRSAVMRADRHVRPSRLLHGPSVAARWFLTMKTIEGEEIGGNPRRDVFAVRADGTELRVTSDPTMEYWMPEWTGTEVYRDEDYAVVSMLARRWTSDAPDATVVEGTAGVYLSYLSFLGTPYVRGSWDLSGTVTTTQSPKLYGRFYDGSVPDRSSAAYFASTGGPTPDVASYAWGSYYLVVQDLDPVNPRIRLCYGMEGGSGISLEIGLVELGMGRLAGRDPQWGSSDSLVLSRLARHAEGGTDTWEIRTTGFWSLYFGNDAEGFTEASVVAPVNAATTRELCRPVFEPDFTYVAYQQQWKATGTTNYIFRESGGLGAKPLTPGLKRAATGEGGMVLVAWR